MRFSREIEVMPITTLRKMVFQNRLDAQPEFDRALTIEATGVFFEELERRRNSQANTIVEFFGIGGSGKSYSAMALAAYLSGSPPHVFFDVGEVLRACSEFQPGECIIVDEKTRDYGIGTLRRSAAYENIIQVVRKFQLSLINCAVVPRLNGGLAHYELEPLFVDAVKRVCRCALYSPMTVGNSVVVYEPMGFVDFKHPGDVWGVEFLSGYEREKDAFIRQLLQVGGVNTHQRIVDDVVSSPEFLKLLEEYKGRGKSVPRKFVLELVQRVAPDLRRNVEAGAIADAILLKLKLGEI